MNLKNRLLLLAASIFALALLLTNFPRAPGEFVENMTFERYTDLFFSYEVTRYPSSAEVSALQLNQTNLTLGVVVDPWNLNFGIVPVGNNTVTRFIELVNLKDKKAKVSFKARGNISSLVSFSMNDFILWPNEKVQVEAKFHGGNAMIGKYLGEIDVIIQRPKYDFLYNLWK